MSWEGSSTPLFLHLLFCSSTFWALENEIMIYNDRIWHHNFPKKIVHTGQWSTRSTMSWHDIALSLLIKVQKCCIHRTLDIFALLSKFQKILLYEYKFISIIHTRNKWLKIFHLVKVYFWKKTFDVAESTRFHPSPFLSFLTKERGNHSLFLSLFQHVSPMWNNYPCQKDFTRLKTKMTLL